MYTAYEHVNKINKKRYIGITSQNPQQRWGCNGCNFKYFEENNNTINA